VGFFRGLDFLLNQVFSFGDSQRLDYGTGHELNFVAFLCCLELLDICKAQHRREVVSHVFERYITISRKLQQYFRYILSFGIPYLSINELVA